MHSLLKPVLKISLSACNWTIFMIKFLSEVVVSIFVSCVFISISFAEQLQDRKNW